MRIKIICMVTGTKTILFSHLKREMSSMTILLSIMGIQIKMRKQSLKIKALDINSFTFLSFAISVTHIFTWKNVNKYYHIIAFYVSAISCFLSMLYLTDIPSIAKSCGV